MYLPKHFAEPDAQALHALIDAQPLASLITLQDGLPCCDEIPFMRHTDAQGRTVLRAHVARANPLWQRAAGQPALVVFRGPQAYVSPNWYPSKAEHGKAVPTWNYVIVQARGVLQVVQDTDWLRAQVSALTDTHEAQRQPAWRVDDAPPDYVAQMLRAIVGIEIAVTALIGKTKVSQNRSAADRVGVAQGLRADGTAQTVAMAELVARWHSD
ncbi:MAG: FMN-binding negative transcriptional regulator [Rhodoferax sp.]